MNIPDHHLCPITQEVMTDPVIASDGQTYERKSITEWLSRGNRRSPLTGTNLSSPVIYENVFARKTLRESKNNISDQLEPNYVRSDLEKCIKQK